MPSTVRNGGMQALWQTPAPERRNANSNPSGSSRKCSISNCTGADSCREGAGLPGIEVILRSAAFALQGEPAEEVAPEPAHLALWLGDKALSDDAVVQDYVAGGPFSRSPVLPTRRKLFLSRRSQPPFSWETARASLLLARVP